jgi:hypothetical protein
MALILALATVPALAYDWVELEPFNGYGAQSGSALCAGVATEANSETYNCVWMLHGGYASFERYDIDLNEWDQKAWFPSGTNRIYTYSGGALCYVPNPNTNPPNGWVFGFPGSMSTNYPSREFWVYYPEFGTPGAGDTGKWERVNSDVPDDEGGVTEGGALCYGGTTTIHGVTHAVIYAFTGQEHQDENDTWWAHFFRYTFEFGAPKDGTWEQLESIEGEKVNMGGALVWLPNWDAEYAEPPWVIATTAGYTDDAFWRYDPAAQYIWTGVNPVLDDDEGAGCCLARLNGDGVVILYGGGSDKFSVVVPAEPSRPGSIWTEDTPAEVEDGAAVAGLNNVFYAECGEDNELRFYALYPYGRGGGQGGGEAGHAAPRVAARAGRGQSHFTVRCQPGPVSLKLVNSAGAVVATVKAEARSGLAELTWPHGSSASGAYLFVLSTPSGTATGKLAIVR